MIYKKKNMVYSILTATTVTKVTAIYNAINYIN